MAISEGRSGRGALLPLRMSQLAGSRGGSLAIFVGKRILWMVPIVFFVILITFVLIPVGISLGVVAALRQNTRVDYITMGFATFAASFPNFVIGALMVVVFSVVLYKATDGNFFLPSADFGLDSHLIMPVITLSL